MQKKDKIKSPWSARRRDATIRAKTLRQNQTDAETVIWHELKAKRMLGLKFKRQFSIGVYFADFVCVEHKVIVEIDGGQHNENKKDEIRTQYLQSRGYEVIRFWNNDVLQNLEGVLSTLSLALSRKCGRGDIGAT